MKTFKNLPLLTVILPHPGRELSPNGHKPMTKKGAMIANKMAVTLKKKARELAKLKAIEAGAKELTAKPNAYKIYWYYIGQKRDADNTVASCKAYMDGICQAIGMDDRDLEIVGVERVYDRVRRGHVVIRFYERVLMEKGGDQ